MKNFTKRILIIILVTSLFYACSGEKKRNVNFLPPLSIQIPTEIKNDVELTKVIKSSEKAINELSDNIEQLVIDGKEVFEMKEEEQGVMDNLKMGKLIVEFAANSAQLGKLIDEFDTYKKKQASQGLMNDAQLNALEKVGATFTNRMTQINEKYKNYFKK
ncbi:hypothetical protein [Lutibacter profundi]|nr:hypothetical protein [Lutibacter profundi]